MTVTGNLEVRGGFVAKGLLLLKFVILHLPSTNGSNGQVYLFLTNSNQLEWTNHAKGKWTTNGNDISNNNTGDVGATVQHLIYYYTMVVVTW